ncbi:MAG TPA: S41 family peptidase [Candidatus Krumholzibacteria bacterium]|nr:S41 family peptidase [Candidatus Krumholzibacteria bacterium]
MQHPWSHASPNAPARQRARSATIIAGLTLLFASAFAVAQPPETHDDLAIDKAMRTSVIDAVARYAESNYVFADRAKDIARALRRHEKDGDYDDIATGSVLAERLTKDLQAVTPDRHLKVFFSAEPRPTQDTPGEPSEEEKAQKRLGAIRRNFGIERAEHLDGNVGYLKLTKFDDPAFAGETLAASMRFLGNTDALIIDLRYNGGGHSDMVALLTSYFFDGDPVHLVDLYDRTTGETSQSWTVPYVPGPHYAGKPVYVVTGTRTFSAAEQFAYCLQKLGRAVVVGETTGGGAHFAQIFQINPHFAVMVPFGNATSPVTKSNWEGTGVIPDVAAAGDVAVRTAHRLALEKLLDSTTDARHADYLKMLVAEMKEQK